MRVLDRFHVVMLGLAGVDDVRWRMQQTLGRRDRTRDPLYGIRRVLQGAATGSAQRHEPRLEAGMIAGDSDGEVALAWAVAQDLGPYGRLPAR